MWQSFTSCNESWAQLGVGNSTSQTTTQAGGGLFSGLSNVLSGSLPDLICRPFDLWASHFGQSVEVLRC